MNQQKTELARRSKTYRKLKLASDMYSLAMKIKCSQLKKRNPTFSESEIIKKAHEIMARGCK